jgi:peptidoglycan/LPS O-acetylase OafA/YrhL
LAWLGTVSYSVYVLHGAVYAILPAFAPGWIMVPLWSVLIGLMGWAGYRWIEMPAQQLGRRYGSMAPVKYVIEDVPSIVRFDPAAWYRWTSK